MLFRKGWRSLLFCFLLSVQLISAEAPAAANLNQTPLPVKQVSKTALSHGSMQTSHVQFPNGDTYWFKQLSIQRTSSKPYSWTLQIPGEQGSFRYIAINNGVRHWYTVPLPANGYLPRTGGFLDTTHRHMYISFPNVYTPIGNGSLVEKATSQPIHVKKTATGYTLTIQIPQQAKDIGEVWALESAQPLVDWTQPNMESIWMLLDMQYSQKWSWDGFYVLSPSSYTPTGPRTFWRNPSNYLARSFVLTGGSRAAEDLGWVMLDTVLPTQNQLGYWETLPRSNWLWKDYQIGYGFYDTRFNTDLARIFLVAYEKYQDPRFLTATQAYARWMMKHSDTRHFTIPGNQLGWLVEDYNHPNAHKKTHASLNHQLAMANYMYELYMATGTTYYQAYGDIIIQGIKNTRDRWIKPDGNLHYAYLSNGQMGLEDYPYLTYNDLYQTQQLLQQMGNLRDPDLDILMQAKRRWMEERGVTGYYQ
ncbi:hypothetical protein [Brevibacillus dissolubilis]|uniref:hypothetical protein n=1 Tax=Brevibacillus dissolubilis TaxID=1844116 RepID=UPI00159BE435|nr:hypothetical protein [Brevibacillus dissolubilis]